MPVAYQCRWCKGPPLSTPPVGACPNCNGFYRHIRVHVADGDVHGATIQPRKDGEVMAASDLMAGDTEDDEQVRETGLRGVDWVFGGGLPRFGIVLFSGKEGSGKSTWLWQLCVDLSKQGLRCLFITSEQTLQGLRRQFKRCGKPPARMLVVAEEDKTKILELIEKHEPEIAVIDSVHHVVNIQDEGGFDMAAGAPRAVTQVAKEAAKLAEELPCLIFLVGHMNNDGSMAGGSSLRHAVDATLELTRSDDQTDMRRVLQFKGKSRFGRPDRKAMYLMGDAGLDDKGPIRDTADNQPPESAGRGRLVN